MEEPDILDNAFQVSMLQNFSSSLTEQDEIN